MFPLEPPDDDGLYIPSVGAWSADKHHFLSRYIDAFTTSMRNKGWNGLHYIDLFAGAGIERVDGKGLDWGSPLIAAQSKFKFTRLHLCELKRRSFEALRNRLPRFPQDKPPQLIRSDANTAISAIVSEIPTRSLSLAFLDPYGLHLHLDTVKRLAERRADLIIFFPDHLDALRNWRTVYAGKKDSNLDMVLGTNDWHDQLIASPKSQWAHVLRTVYESQLKKIGYDHFDHERITIEGGRALYLLIFCSRDKAGGTIWRRIATKKPGGQQAFDFDG